MIRHLLHLLWMILGWILLILLTTLLYALSFLPRKKRPWYTRLFHLWCKVWVDALGVDLRLHQKNRHPLPGQYILIANHPSAFEDIGIPALFPVYSLAKIEVSQWPIVGRISMAAGTLFVHRESKESRQQAGELIIQRLAKGDNIALYPEGGIKGKRLHDHFRYGVFRISMQTGIPILPLFLHYEAQDQFHWSDQTLPHKILQFMTSSNNRANYYIYDAFDPRDFKDHESYTNEVYQQFLRWQERHLD
jgi:1-acyl-sn-glycerol-3-phosphate acyltransferase